MPRPVHRYGEYRIDPLARELYRADSLVPLSPKVFDCLVYLIEHRDRAVGRDELIAAVWGRADVSDTLLGQTLLKARRAVGDDGNEQHAIRTIPRFGYRWIGTLTDTPSEPLPDDRPAPASGTPPAVRARSRVQVVVAVSLVLVALLAALALRYARQRPDAGPDAVVAIPADMLVVVPAEVEAGEDWSWLRLGSMDLVASRLRHAGLPAAPSETVVAAWRSARRHPGRAAHDTVQAIADLTGARRIVVPRVRHEGDAWRVELDLRVAAEAPRSAHGVADDPITASRAASDRLLEMLGASPPPRDDAPTPISLEDLDQRAQAALLGDDFDLARRMLEAAPAHLRETPTAHVRLAEVEYRIGELTAAREHLERALDGISATDDPVLRARALRVLGVFAVREVRSLDALPIFQQVVDLVDSTHEPSIVGQAHTGLAAALTNLGRHEEAATALAHARVALTLANDALGLARVDANEGILDNSRGRPAEAIPLLERAADRFRKFGAMNDLAQTLTALVKSQLAMLDTEAALATSDSLLPQRESVANPRSRGNFDLQRARALAAVGRLREARTLIAELAADPALANEAELPGSVAAEHARQRLAGGDADGAIESARRAVASLPTLDEAHVRSQAWLVLSRALRDAGRTAEAATETDRFARWADAHPDIPGVSLLARLAAAEQHRLEGRAADSDADYDLALAEADRWAMPIDTLAVASSYGNALLAERKLDRAAIVIGRVARWADRDFDCAVLQVRLFDALGQTEAAQGARARAGLLAGERSLPAIVGPAATTEP